MTAAFLLGTAALLLLAGGKKQISTDEAIGRIKRRVYVEIEAAQNAGIPLYEKYINLTQDNIDALREIGERFGWKQTRRSIESGKSYSEAYFNSLRRAYNAITGVQGIGSADSHKVRNADGKVILEWRDMEAAAAHVKQEQDLAELEARLAKTRRAIRNNRRAFNRAPVAPKFQDEQLYQESQFPDQPQQLALFGIGRLKDNAENFIWGKDQLYVIMYKDGNNPNTIEVVHDVYNVIDSIKEKLSELNRHGYKIVKKYGDWSYTLSNGLKYYFIRVDCVVAY